MVLPRILYTDHVIFKGFLNLMATAAYQHFADLLYKDFKGVPFSEDPTK